MDQRYDKQEWKQALFQAAWWAALCFVVLVGLATAQTQRRELNVREMRSGAALDGKGKLWAVVVGVSQYRYLKPEQQLKFAHRDAQSFADFLRSPNGGGYPASQLTLLLNQNASLAAIRSALGTTLPRSVEPDDVVVIYFAGHGVVEGANDGYLLAHDSDPQNLYATALQLTELDRIITQRLKARTVMLIADACHAGQLGWAARGSAEEQLMVNRYLDEVGKSGKGVFRILASRADQRSYEDVKWGGGHGCFTWFLLEGLKGKADRDNDNFVRAAELLEYLGENVPRATQSLQHPQAAGQIEPRLPLAVLAATKPKTENVSIGVPSSADAVLEVRGTPGLEIYLNNSFKGRILPNGLLMIEKLKAGDYDLMVMAKNVERHSQKLNLNEGKVRLDLGRISTDGVSPLVAQVRQALQAGQLTAAYNSYQQLLAQAPKDPQRPALEATLVSRLSDLGQQAINTYVQSSGMASTQNMFAQATEAYRLLKTLTPDDTSVEAKYLFCSGRLRIEQQNFQEAATLLERATTLDPRAAYAFNALGVANRGLKRAKPATDAFRRAASLAPAWALPQIQLGLQQIEEGRADKAEPYFKEAARLDARHFFPHAQLARLYLSLNRLKDAEQSAREALSRMPNDGATHLVLGQIYEVTGRCPQAAEAFDKGLSLLPNLELKQREEFQRRADKCRKKKNK